MYPKKAKRKEIIYRNSQCADLHQLSTGTHPKRRGAGSLRAKNCQKSEIKAIKKT
jgi:hypothetical protein